jgi:hypothetical protein
MLGEPHKFVKCLPTCMEDYAQQNTKEKMRLGFYIIVRLFSHATIVI